MNGILPARGGDAVKIVLAKRSVERSSYPAIISSFARPGAVRLRDRGRWCSLYAITQGLLPRPPQLPDLPAFDDLLLGRASAARCCSSLDADRRDRAIVLIAVLRAGSSRSGQHLKQGLAIFREPRRYLREVAAWQAGRLAACASPRSGSSSTPSTSAARSRTCSW